MQTAPQGTLDQIVLLYRSSVPAIEASLGTYAIRLFWILALAEFGWAGIQLAFRRADMNEFLAALMNQVLFIGFFFSLLLNSGAWATSIVTSFRQAGSVASVAAGGSANLGPSDIVGIGIDLAGSVADQTTLLNPAQSLGFIIVAIVLLICFALIALWMIEALVQSYVIISAGALFMGFGGSRWTKDLALKILTGAVSIGAKLFVLQLLVGLGESIMRGWLRAAAGATLTFRDLWVMLASSLVMVGLTKGVPDLVQSLINGTAFAGGGGLLGAAAAAGGAAGAAAGMAVGGGSAVAGAAKLASEQLASQGTSGGGNSAARPAAFAAAIARNLGGAAVADVGARLGGRAHFGNMSGRMAQDLHSRANTARAERQHRDAQAGGTAGDGPNGAPDGGRNGASGDAGADTIGPSDPA